jgi:hypothetical protein
VYIDGCNSNDIQLCLDYHTNHNIAIWVHPSLYNELDDRLNKYNNTIANTTDNNEIELTNLKSSLTSNLSSKLVGALDLNYLYGECHYSPASLPQHRVESMLFFTVKENSDDGFNKYFDSVSNYNWDKVGGLTSLNSFSFRDNITRHLLTETCNITSQNKVRDNVSEMISPTDTMKNNSFKRNIDQSVERDPHAMMSSSATYNDSWKTHDGDSDNTKRAKRQSKKTYKASQASMDNDTLLDADLIMLCDLHYTTWEGSVIKSINDNKIGRVIEIGRSFVKAISYPNGDIIRVRPSEAALVDQTSDEYSLFIDMESSGVSYMPSNSITDITSTTEVTVPNKAYDDEYQSSSDSEIDENAEC